MKNIYLCIPIFLTLFSCKEENRDYYDSNSDVEILNDNEYAVDSSAALPDVENYMIDEELVNPEQYVEEITPYEITYEDAIVSNSIYEIKTFIDKNPNHEELDELERRIIDLEVDKIYRDKNTGKMPVSEKINSSNSLNSNITIKNDTSCDLTIRYSGPHSKIITIAPNKSKSIDLMSGNYRVAASACGYNYAGSESLSGNYNSSYYIATTRY